MTITEKIQACIQQLPASYQAEVLDFVEYLLAKTSQGTDVREEIAWNVLSLSCAMRGMEDEVGSQYTEADLKVVFS